MPDLRFNPEEMRLRGFDPRAIAEAQLAKEANTAAAVLIKDIEVTFGRIPRPRITRSVARGLDDEWTLSDDRARELALEDPEQDWRDVSAETINSYQEYFNFADAEGCRFYLPAFMREYLRGFPQESYDAVYWVCTKPEKLTALNEAERACVTKFMDLCHKYESESPRQ
ncbi:MAG: hypothetical protein IPL39_06180 [Opitutaceae bacterium]|nr:hypothetical protein [Opitutaceae bacterium]